MTRLNSGEPTGHFGSGIPGSTMPGRVQANSGTLSAAEVADVSA